MKSLFTIARRLTLPASHASETENNFHRDSRIFPAVHVASLVIWAFLASIFLFDLFTVSDHVSISFAYTVPIILSVLEPRPRPILYAVIGGILSFIGTFVQPPRDMSLTVLLANRSLAIFMQALAAVLVVLQHRLLLRAREQAETQRRLVDILSHEVGTALTTVTGQAYRLAKLTGPIASEDLRQRADKLRRAVERIEAIISRIRIASSLGERTISAASEPVDVQALLLQIVEQINEDRRSHQIDFQRSADPTIVLGDALMIHQIFDNILSNSIKYSPQNSSISISVNSGPGTVLVTITDQGSGISPEELPQIRSAYFRGRNSQGISGAGLGLHVVDRLVEGHHGRLSIESVVGAGTTIRIELPRAPAAT
jgi:signal transduction histidine kinase